jgi:sugar phosphate isomerase/epimerase
MGNTHIGPAAYPPGLHAQGPLLASASVTSAAPPAGARIACSTVSLFGRSLHAIFPLLAEAGFRFVELMVTKDPDSRDPDVVSELAEDHGVAIAAVHAPFLLVTRSVWGADPVGKIARAVELAERVGAPLVVVHPPYRWQRTYRTWLREALPGLSESTAVRVAVENMFPVRVGGRTLGGLHAIRSLEDLGGFEHVVLDTSHAAVAGLDLLEAVRTLRDRLAHVHLSDNAGKGWDSHLPLGEGVLDLDPFLEELVAVGYAGTISLEIDLRHLENDPAALHRTLVANRERCAARLHLPV